MQAVCAPDEGEVEPAAHSEQAVELDEALKVFPLHAVHTPLTTAEPAGHEVQEVAPAPAVDPGAHAVQAPAPAALKVLALQLVQELAPSEEKDPAAQSRQGKPFSE